MDSRSADVSKTPRPVALHPRARRAFGFEGLALAVPGTVLVGLGGEVLVVRADGGLEPVLLPGHPRPGIAADPTAVRRPVAEGSQPSPPRGSPDRSPGVWPEVTDAR